jgi:succinate dehydrogenase / fumarate reductase flavoprotein subunit
MGGIDTNAKCETDIKGFYAAGECACVSVHGANRLGGNSLLDTIVFGKLAAFAIDAYLQNNDVTFNEKLLLSKKEEMEKKIHTLIHEGTEKPYTILSDLSKIMSSNVGIFRIKEELEQAVQDIVAVKERYKNVHVSSPKLHMNHELLNAIELEYMLEVAHTIALGASLREESRGAHFRRDFNSRNDANWLKHTIARIDKDGKPVISSKQVVITKFQPMERKY